MLRKHSKCTYVHYFQVDSAEGGRQLKMEVYLNLMTTAYARADDNFHELMIMSMLSGLYPMV